MTRAITCTTRPPRPGERQGVDYYFLDEEAFLKRMEAGEFLEHATVYGHWYGTPKAGVYKQLLLGKDVLLNIDVQGAATVCAQAPLDAQLQRSLVTVFLAPQNLAELEARLRKRGTDSPAELQARLSAAREEIEQGRHFQHWITSATVEEDLRQLEAIIQAERLRQR